MKKNRLAQSGPYRRGLGAGAVIQGSVVARDADPNSSILNSEIYAEVSSDAQGGTDMRPSLTPIFQDSQLKVRLEMTVDYAPAVLSAPEDVDVRLELSADAGASWQLLSEADPCAVLNINNGSDGEGGINNVTRNQVTAQAEASIGALFPNYEGTEIIARALARTSSTSEAFVVSEGDPGNCRLYLQELAS